MCKTLVRIQEFYESPQFKNKVFTLKEFKYWYIKNSNSGKISGKFTYYTDWVGFNFPDWVLKEFKSKFKLYKKEKEFLEIIENNIIEDKFYIIGTSSKNEEVIRHETAHALYYLNEEYKNKINEELKKLSGYIKNKIYNYLKQTGYNKDVWNDEMHAYIICPADYLPVKRSTLNKIKIKQIFETYESKMY